MAAGAGGGGGFGGGDAAAGDPVTTLIWVSHAFIPTSSGSPYVLGSSEYLTTTVLDKFDYSSYDPILNATRVYMNPAKMIDTFTLATGYPGTVIRGEDVEEIIKLFSNKPISDYKANDMTTAFPPLRITAADDTKPTNLYNLYKDHDILYQKKLQAHEDTTTVTISSYDMSSSPRILNYNLQCVKAEEPEDIRLKSGLYVITSRATPKRFNYIDLAKEIRTPATSCEINPAILEELENIHIPARTLTIDDLIPVFSCLCTKLSIKTYNLVIIGCGSIYFPSGPAGKGLHTTATAIARAPINFERNPLKMLLDQIPAEQFIGYNTDDLLEKLQSLAAKRIATARAGRGGARKTLKRRGNRKARSTKGSKKLANRRHIVRHRRRPYSRTKS